MDSHGTEANLLYCVRSIQIGSFFWSAFSCIRTEISVFSLNIGNTGQQKNSVLEHFSRSASLLHSSTDGSTYAINNTNGRTRITSTNKATVADTNIVLSIYLSNSKELLVTPFTYIITSLLQHIKIIWNEELIKFHTFILKLF